MTSAYSSIAGGSEWPSGTAKFPGLKSIVFAEFSSDSSNASPTLFLKCRNFPNLGNRFGEFSMLHRTEKNIPLEAENN